LSFVNWFKPSTRIRNLFMRLVDKLSGRFYEGPSPPRRLNDSARLFKLMHPKATADEWEAFARRQAANAYRDGFVRGYGWQERGWEGPAMEPERIAELQAHDWSLADENPSLERLLATGYDPDGPYASYSLEQQRAFAEALGGAQYQMQVELKEENDG
jgi:hypothetical protein